MLLRNLFEETKKPDLNEIFRKFFPLAMKEIGLKDLPEIELVARVHDLHQPTFGKFVNNTNTIYLGIANRHPLDILRTLAHELVHYKQNIEHKLDATSGHTGSPAENEAHELAGIIMRHFNKKHPEYFDDMAIVIKEGWVNDFKKEFIRKGKQSLATAATIGALSGAVNLYDIAKDKAHHQPPQQQQQQQLIPSDDNTDVYPDQTVSTKPEEKTKSSPTINNHQKYIEAQKATTLPGKFQNDLKTAAIGESIVGLELDQFLGQWSYESGNFTQFDEMYRGNFEIYKTKKWFLDHYWKNKSIRKSLGNTRPDDAWRFRGRGICQLTGRDNYTAAGNALGINLVESPALASHPKYIIPIAIWYWKNRVVNKVGPENVGDTVAVTRAINHGESSENIQKRHSLVRKFHDFFSKGL